MTSDFSGISTAAASVQHFIQYTAFTPDDGEQTGIATVTANVTANGEHHIPFTEAAKIPGFVEGVALWEPGDPRTVLLGPGTDAPGHPDWCHDHIDDGGDGRSFCWGERTDFGDTYVHLTRDSDGATKVYYYAELMDCQGVDLTAAEAREQAEELREIAAKLDALADQADADAAASQ